MQYVPGFISTLISVIAFLLVLYGPHDGSFKSMVRCPRCIIMVLLFFALTVTHFIPAR